MHADLRREEDIVSLFKTVDGIGPLVAELWSTNITSYFLCAREAVKRMSTRHGGKDGAIVNVSSMAGTRGGGERRVGYGASKGRRASFVSSTLLKVAGGA